jgi:WD40 repeat protein
VKSGTEVVQTISQQGPVSLVAFLPDGTCIVTRLEYNTVRVWDAISGIRLSDYGPDTLYYLFPSTIRVTPGDQWLMDRSTNRTVSKLPAFIGLRCLATHDRSLAMGTTDGRVFVIHFPSGVSINRETRFTED